MYLFLNNIREYKQEHGKVDFTSIEKLRENLIIENDVIKGIRYEKQADSKKVKNTYQSTL